MRERVLAIVSLIAQYVTEERELLNESDIVEELLAAGYAAEEIDAAFNWMESLALQHRSRPSFAMELPTHRVFSADEMRGLCREARGFLVRLRALGIIDDDSQEEIIEKSLQMTDDEVSLKEVKAITALTLFARFQDDWLREVDCFLEDDWARFYH